MAPEIVAAILDWRDEDNNVSPGGAEADYYTTLKPPYLPRNGTIETMRELLMVRGISSQLLLGEGEDVPELDDSAENSSTSLSRNPSSRDRGLSEFLTV